MANDAKPLTCRSLLAMTGLVVRESFRSFLFNRGTEKAATLAYYAFFAMIPLLLILVIGASTIITSSDRALQAIGEATAEISPVFNRVILREVQGLAQQRAWSVISLFVLFWWVTPLTGAIRNAFGAIFKATVQLPFYKAKLRDAVAVVLLLVLLVLFVAGKAISRVLLAGQMVAWSPLLRFATVAVRAMVALVCAALFYLAMAPVRLRLSLLFTGALLTTLLLGLMGPVFGLVLRFNPDYGYAFGSLKAVFLLFVWVYYCFAVVLFVTEVMANIRRREALVLKHLFLPSTPRRWPKVLLQRFTRTYAPGETIFEEGDEGHEMFYVVEGRVRLLKGGHTVAEMGAGQYFGEMAMLIASPRTARAVAGEDGVLLAAVSEENFDVVLRENPAIVRSILQEMARRLKTMDERAVAAAASGSPRAS